MTNLIFNVPDYLVNIGASKATAAQAAFAALVQEYAGANIILQITAAGKTELIGNAVKEVLFWGNSGSLWQAYAAVEKMVITPDMAPFLTGAHKQEFKNKLIQIISSL